MKDITTRCHSCARPFEIEVDEDTLYIFQQNGRSRFDLLNTEASCPNCGRWHGDGYSMEAIEVQS